jgi:cobalt-zinc-cadmium efflux system protein
MGAGHGHSHGPSEKQSKRLGLTLALVAVYMVAELVGGLLANSLALLADAGHMLSDAGALVVSLLALRVARRPASATHTFGYQRAEILAALGNGALLVAIAAYIFYEAYQRIGAPPEVRGGLMLAVAAGGLAVNLAGLWILHGGKSESLNVRGAWLHVLSDTMGSVGVIVAGVLIIVFGWNWADPAASMVIGLLVVYSSWSLLAETVGVLMQAVPRRIDLTAVEAALTSVDGVVEVHDLHVWSLTSGRDMMSAHIAVAPGVDRQGIVEAIHHRLRHDFDLHHSTLQLDCPGECAPCEPYARAGHH